MYHAVFINVLLAIISALIAIAFYAALLPRRGPHIASYSVCLSDRPVIVFVYFFTVEPSYERTSKIEKLLFSLMGQRHVCTFRHAQRAAYRTAISAAQILVYTLRSRKFCISQHHIDTPSCVVNIPSAIIISSSLLYSRFHIVCPSLSPFECNIQWRRNQVKSGGINIEKIEGVESGEGLCPAQLGVWGLAAPPPQKKIQFCAKKIMQFWASFGTSFLYYSRKWGGGLSPQSWKWGPIPCPPCSDAYGNIHVAFCFFFGIFCV